MKMETIILVSLLETICSISGFAEQVMPSQLMAEYELNHDGLRIQISRYEQIIEVLDSDSGNVHRFSRSEYEFRTDGKRVDWIMKDWFGLDSPDTADLVEPSSHNRTIWDGSMYIELGYPPIGYDKKKGSAFFSDTKKSDFVLTAYGGYNTLDGVFWGDKKEIPRILDQSSDISLRSKMEEANGTYCYVIDAITPNGKYSLWIDPEHGYNIAKAKVHKTGDDLLYGKPISQHRRRTTNRSGGAKYTGPRRTGNRREEFSFSLDRVEFQQVGDCWVPVEAYYQHTTKFDDGRVLVERKHDKRVFIDLEPDFEAVGAFVPDIPDGMRILLEGAPGITYEWQAGEIVPVVDKLVIADLDRMTDEIMAEGPVSSKPVSVKKSDTLDEESHVASDMQPPAQASESASQPEVLAESGMSPIFLLLITIGMLILGIIAWLVLRRHKVWEE
jgi:hypothetical protein